MKKHLKKILLGFFVLFIATFGYFYMTTNIEEIPYSTIIYDIK
jgi:hypothetical protein